VVEGVEELGAQLDVPALIGAGILERAGIEAGEPGTVEVKESKVEDVRALLPAEVVGKLFDRAVAAGTQAAIERAGDAQREGHLHVVGVHVRVEFGSKRDGAQAAAQRIDLTVRSRACDCGRRNSSKTPWC
jgi:hypothetical protein